jgi:hypothetical protein
MQVSIQHMPKEPVAQRGRPAVHPKRLLLAVNEEFLDSIDSWRRDQPDIPSRSEAIRRLVEEALKAKQR